MPTKGSHCTSETKEKLHLANIGKHHTREAKEKISQGNLGRHHTLDELEKMRQSNLGKHRSSKTKEKNRQAHLGKRHSPEAKAKIGQARLGKHHTIETIEKIRRAHSTPKAIERTRLTHTGRKHTAQEIEKSRLSNLGKHNNKHTPETIGKMRLAHLGAQCTTQTKEKISVSLMGRHLTPEHIEAIRYVKNRPEAREKMSKNTKRLFKDPEYVKNWTNGIHSKTRLEKRVDVLLQALYPNEFKYNGGYECGITIGGFTPDFVNVNGKKQLIEAFGSHWHPEGNDKIKHNRYAEYGYSSLIIWDYELKDEKAVVQKIIEFVGMEPHQYFDAQPTGATL